MSLEQYIIPVSLQKFFIISCRIHRISCTEYSLYSELQVSGYPDPEPAFCRVSLLMTFCVSLLHHFHCTVHGMPLLYSIYCMYGAKL
jgi:hypothetical protein